MYKGQRGKCTRMEKLLRRPRWKLQEEIHDKNRVLYHVTPTAPVKLDGEERSESLDRNHWYPYVDRDLVKIFATWSADGMYHATMDPQAKNSWMKWKSISICRVRPWKKGLCAICKAELLSHRMVGARRRGTPSSQRRKQNHQRSATVDAIARYSDSALDRAMVDCFLAV